MRKPFTQLLGFLIILSWPLSSMGNVYNYAGISARDSIADNHLEFVMTFSEDVVLGDLDELIITEKGTATAVLSIPITAEMIEGNIVTVSYGYDPAIGDLKADSEYIVAFDSGVIKDVNGNAWDDNSDITAWTFTSGSDVKISMGGELDAIDFKVYPNPFNDFVRIDNFEKLTKVVISDITGRKVIEVEEPQHVIRTEELVNGLYFISMYNGLDVVKVSKLIKR